MDRIQRNIDMTLDNINRTNELIVNTQDRKVKQVLQQKNERREKALEGMVSSLRHPGQP